jgi:8-amino-7-oxononanoate synthase
VAMGLQERVFARIHTFGKALGVHGAAVVGSTMLRDYLINFARPFIYSTALPPHSLLAIRCAHEQLKNGADAREQLHSQLMHFRQRVSDVLPASTWTASLSPIQCLIVPGNIVAGYVATAAQAAGFDVRAILSPTVPAGQERLRICIHAYNTNDEIDRLVTVLRVVQA